MRNILYLSIIFIFLLSSNSYGNITTITYIHEAKANFENTDKDTLVLFDVDRTLVIMKDLWLKSGKSGFLKKIRIHPSYNLLTSEEQDILLSIVLLKTTHQIIEEEAIEIIHRLQKNHIKTIVFSTMLTGRFGYILDMELWRLNTLKNLNLFFHEAFPEFPEILFDSSQCNKSPTFKEGLLCTSKKMKGEVLRLFLDKINWYPKKIIMIDDQISSLKSVENELNKLEGIEFQGIHYQYVEKMFKGQIFNEALISFQIDYLIKHHIWLTDEECAPFILNQF